jgi:hypothetical protein
MAYPERWDPPRNDVRAEVFTDTGKWKYSVKLDYTKTAKLAKLAKLANDSGYIEPVIAAASALFVATKAGTSEVTFEYLPRGWHMFVPDPPNGWPIMVTGGKES